ncbi:hypothetical protein VVZ59_27515, partial [Klebsiella pneumoniae]
MNNSVKIYTSHHKPSAFLNAAIIKPLHVGKANSCNEIGNDSNLLIVFYVQIVPDDFVMQLHR